MDSCPFCGYGPIAATEAQCPTCGVTLSQASLPSGTRLAGGRYTVGRVLGQGGFGITYQGADTMLRRRVAIKELFPDGSQRRGSTITPPHTLGTAGLADARNRFLEEARTLAQFDHPGIVRVHDAFEENGTAYLAMEFLDGETLMGRISRQGKIEPAEAAGLAVKVAEALQVVHAAGLLHRDIKPDNLFLTHDGRVVLIDFGSARAYQAGKTVSATRTITAGYAPLEQYSSTARFGPYTDVYALGATLYHALTGSRPPDATDRLINPGPISLPPEVPASLGTAVERAMAIMVQDRPQSAAELIALLQQRAGENQGQAPGASVAEMIRTARPGATIQIPAGTHRLKQPLVIDKPLRLVGQGMDRTTLLLDASGDVLQMKASGESALEGLTVSLSANRSGDLVSCWAGSLSLIRCRLKGAAGRKEGKGCGLLLTPGARAEVRESVFEQNEWVGLLALGTVTAESCSITGNGTGLLVQGEAGCTIRSTRCTENAGDGVQVTGKAEFRAERSDCSGNKAAGIAISEAARCTVLESTCSRNGTDGIVVQGTAAPVLTGNVIQGNKGCGISLRSESRGTVSRNRIQENPQGGIMAFDEAEPVLDGNTLTGNGCAGIGFHGQAGGKAQGNTCSGSPVGISLEGRSKPVLERNDCGGNETGICFGFGARGTATGNTCHDNSQYGIWIKGYGGEISLSGNRCWNNKLMDQL